MCGPPSNGVGLNISVMSCGDRLMVAVLAFADALPDGPELAVALQGSFDELVAATGAGELDRARSA